jgi:pyrroline-5-carboxylate reductase
MSSSPEESSTGGRIAFLGVGRLGGALIREFVASGTIPTSQVIGTHHSDARAAELQQSLGVRITTSNAEAVRQASVVFLCVRPRQMRDLATEIADSVEERHTIVSPVVGVTLARLRSALPRAGSVLRVLPAIPVTTSARGVSFVSGEGDAAAEALREVEGLFACLGKVLPVAENVLDRCAVLAGSAPAFFAEIYLGWKSLLEEHGVPEEHAEDILRATAESVSRTLGGGSAALAQMQEEMATPGGVTRAGLDALRRSDVKGMLERVAAAGLERLRDIDRATHSTITRKPTL